MAKPKRAPLHDAILSGVPLGFAISPRNLNIHPKESRSDSEGRMYKTHRPSFGELYIVLG